MLFGSSDSRPEAGVLSADLLRTSLVLHVSTLASAYVDLGIEKKEEGKKKKKNKRASKFIKTNIVAIAFLRFCNVQSVR